jgi:hypothetical protein
MLGPQHYRALLKLFLQTGQVDWFEWARLKSLSHAQVYATPLAMLLYQVAFLSIFSEGSIPG